MLIVARFSSVSEKSLLCVPMCTNRKTIAVYFVDKQIAPKKLNLDRSSTSTRCVNRKLYFIIGISAGGTQLFREMELKFKRHLLYLVTLPKLQVRIFVPLILIPRAEYFSFCIQNSHSPNLLLHNCTNLSFTTFRVISQSHKFHKSNSLSEF